MPTIGQLIRGARKKRHYKARTAALMGCPQQSGTVTAVKVIKPKKPNSAQRLVARVKLRNGYEITARVPGEENGLQEHAEVLVRGGRSPDLPGIKYTVIRGGRSGAPPPGDLKKWGVRRSQQRSKYGTKRKK